MSQLAYLNSLAESDGSSNIDLLLSEVITKDVVERYLSLVFTSTLTKYGISVVELKKSISNFSGVRWLVSTSLHNIAVAEGVATEYETHKSGMLFGFVSDSITDADIKQKLQQLATIYSTIVSNKAEFSRGFHIRTLIDQIIDDGVFWTRLYKRQPEESRALIVAPFRAAIIDLKPDVFVSTTDEDLTILNIPLIYYMIRLGVWDDIEIDMISLYYQRISDVGRTIDDVDRRWDDLTAYLNDLLSLHIAGMIDINFNYSVFRLTGPIKNLIYNYSSIISNTINVNIHKSSMQLNDDYILKRIRYFVRSNNEYVSGRVHVEWNPYHLLLKKLINAARDDGLIMDEIVKNSSGQPVYRPVEFSAEIKAGEDEVERLMVSNLDRLYQQGLISYEKWDGRINPNINIYWQLPDTVTDRDKKVLLYVASELRESTRQSVAITNDYSSYLRGSFEYGIRAFNSGSVHEWVTAINSLIANLDLKVDCFGIHQMA